MKIASIDIGTNAIKSKIFKTTPTSIEFLEGIRSPIRLGDEVFRDGKLSNEKLDLVIQTIKEYEEIFKRNKIERYEIVATSAFRIQLIRRMQEDILKRQYIIHCELFLDLRRLN